nr:copia protein [Tanacetum cinerariifolium]
MSANDKFGLGYGDYRYGSILSYENEVLQSVFMNKECDLENTPVNDRYAEGMHAVPSPMTGNYMPSGPDVKIDYSQFTYGPKQTSADELDSKPVEFVSSDSDSSIETTTSMPAPVANAPKIVSEPKVWTDAPIIEEYESDSDDDSVSNVQENIEKPRFAFTNSVKHVKSPRENVKETGTPTHYPKIEKQDRHSHTRKGLGYARKSCFVCGSFSHLIRDYDFHENKMANQAALTKSKEHDTGQQAHKQDDPHKALKDKEIIDSRYSRHMTGNKAHLADYQEFKGGSVAFGGSNGKFDGKSDLGFLVGYSLNSKAFRVYNLETKRVEENMHDVNTNNTNLLNAVSAPVSVVGPSRALDDDGLSYPDDPSMPHLEDIYASSSAGILQIHLMMMKVCSSAGVFTDSSYDDESVKAIGTKWVYKNKKNERGVVVRNKARLVAQGHRQEEGIDYDKVFAHVARIEAIRIFLAFASYMGFTVYQMDVKSVFLYDTIDEEVYVTQPPGFVDPKFLNKVYKVVKALYGLH